MERLKEITKNFKRQLARKTRIITLPITNKRFLKYILRICRLEKNYIFWVSYETREGKLLKMPKFKKKAGLKKWLTKNNVFNTHVNSNEYDVCRFNGKSIPSGILEKFGFNIETNELVLRFPDKKTNKLSKFCWKIYGERTMIETKN